MEQKIMNLEDYRLAKKCIIAIQQLEEDKKKLDKAIERFTIGTLPDFALRTLEKERANIYDNQFRWELQLKLIERKCFGLEKVSYFPEDDVKFDQGLPGPIGASAEEHFAKLFEQIVSAGKEES